MSVTRPEQGALQLDSSQPRGRLASPDCCACLDLSELHIITVAALMCGVHQHVACHAQDASMLSQAEHRDRQAAPSASAGLHSGGSMLSSRCHKPSPRSCICSLCIPVTACMLSCPSSWRTTPRTGIHSQSTKTRQVHLADALRWLHSSLSQLPSSLPAAPGSASA